MNNETFKLFLTTIVSVLMVLGVFAVTLVVYFDTKSLYSLWAMLGLLIPGMAMSPDTNGRSAKSKPEAAKAKEHTQPAEA